MSKSKNSIGAIVLGGHVQGLGIVRILGREGKPIVVIDNTKINLAKHSKFCNKFYHVNDDSLFDFLILLSQNQQYHGWVIFPTNDFHVKILSQNKELLEKNFVISTDSWSVISKFYNKRITYKIAKSLNIPIAKTIFPDSINDLNTLDVEFPCIIKPAVMHEFYKQVKKKVFICKDLHDLKAKYNKALQLIPASEIIIQEIIKGPSKNQFSACFLFINGISYIHLTACRMRQHPLDFGNATTYAETMDIPVIKEFGERILKETNYNGVCEVEFKLDENDNQYKFLEVNTRTWKWHTIANKAGTPFLAKYFEYLTGMKILPIEGFKKASFFHLLTDFPVQIQLLFKGFDYWHHKSKNIEHAVWANDDLAPWFYEKLYVLFYIFRR